ncbi:MAG TPA: hypothetical protein VL614_03360 [Acetobacteraceae bacterium]|jgi:hypothetical protein|nr:hypothetical protein [Acetobacteraceae bacterium]
MSDDEPAYTGRLLPAGNDKVELWLTDRLGVVIRVVGHRDRAGGGYLLKSTAVETPGYLRLPLVDEEA